MNTFLAHEQAVILLIDLILGAVATFFAIELWSRTREPAWMFMVIAVIAWFGGVVFRVLESFGIVAPTERFVLGLSLYPILVESVPWLLIIVALLTAIRATHE